MDFDNNFGLDENGDLKVIDGVEAINQSIRNILLTNHGDKPFNYYFGAGLDEYRFEDVTRGMLTSLENHIEEVLESKEPRIKDVIAEALFDDINEIITVLITYEYANNRYSTSYTIVKDNGGI